MSRHTNGIFRTWSLVLVAACYSPPRPDCGFICGPGAACPADYHCATDGHCHLDGSSDASRCADAGVPDSLPIDAAMADTTPPHVLSTNPANNEMNVPLDRIITVAFDEAVINVPTSLLVTATTGLPGTVTAISSAIYTFTPDAPWPAATTIDVTVTATVMDLSGNPLPAAYDFSFQTQ